MESAWIRRIREHKNGKAVGVYSICSSNRFVLESAVQQAINDGSVLLVESTSNQVNQFGGYAGFTPRAFARSIRALAESLRFPAGRVVLGGDHLGPYPWRKEKAGKAMEYAAALVRAYVEADFTKIHLDASMPCAGDAPPGMPLPAQTAAERTADLCRVAEETHRRLGVKSRVPLYVVGTDVPSPGGADASESGAGISSVRDVETTLRLTRDAFARRKLLHAWERTVALVVRPGIEYGNEGVVGYSSGRARRLAETIARHERMVYEAHSTDFQRREALERMVRDHFAILKAGPCLTFAFREAVFALEHMETEWLSRRRGVSLSKIRQTLDRAMIRNPVHWKAYYPGNRRVQAFARKYSLNDRCRYYWSVPPVRRALARLIRNLEAFPVPLSLVSQYMPVQYDAVRDGTLPNRPADLIRAAVMEITSAYAAACGYRAV